MKRARFGFTMVETLVVMAVLVLMATMAYPRISRWRTGYDLRSAKQQVAAAIATTRAAAVQKGRPARFIVAGNVIRATVDTNAAGAAVTVVPPIDLLATFGVTLATQNIPGNELLYGSRGVIAPQAAMPRYYLTNSAGRDSLCVSGVGVLLKRGCIQ